MSTAHPSMSAQAVATPNTLEYWAAKKPEAVAVVDDADRVLTWREWNDKADAFASALQRRGLVAGDIVVVRTQNRLEWSVLAQALGKLGCRLLGMNWRLTPAEVKFVTNNSQAAAIICDDAQPEGLLGAFGSEPLKACVSLDADAPGFERFQALMDEPGPRRFFSTSDPALVLYTSGTTGLPKGVVKPLALDERGREYLADIARNNDGRDDNVYLMALPMHHGAGPGHLFSTKRSGGKAVLLKKFDPLRMLQLIEKHRVTHLTAVPTMYKRIAALPPGTVESFDLSSLRMLNVGAAPVTKELKAWIIEKLGDCLYESYGSTETGMMTCIEPRMQKLKPGSSGLPYKHVKLEIRGEAGEPLGVGEVGEIWANTPQVITSYLNAAPLDPETLDARGFFRTGDMGYLDADGYLFISDRAKDMVISGGVNIYPAEVEAALLTHPAIADAAVIGIPDDEFGESVMAFCEVKAGHTTDAAAVLSHCAQSLASYKRPKAIEFVAELPRNTMGKIVKKELREPFWRGRDRRV